LFGVAVLPPAFCWPYFAWSRSACSIRTSAHGTSSSSAISIGSAVLMPCPISGFFEMIVTMLSGVMRMNAFGTKATGGACGPCASTPVSGSM
jgi:hypothetical protein